MPSKLENIVQRASRLYPLYKGRGRLALSSFLRRSDFDASDITLTTLATEQRIYVVTNDYIGRMVTFFGDLDPAISTVVRRLIRPGDVVLDIGANVGIFTLQIAAAVGPHGFVYAFEPVKRLASLLIRSVELNALENVNVSNFALSDTVGTGTMAVAENALGCSKLILSGQGESCLITTLDEVDFGAHFRRPRLVKIDVEGHEAQVLSGGRAFLNQHKPDYVVFESHSDRGNFWQRPEVAILSELGYEFSEIQRNVFARPRLRKVRAQDRNSFESYDFLASLEQ